MFRRYLSIAIVLLLLIGSYFLFFYEKKGDNQYLLYYQKIISREVFDEETSLLNIDVNQSVNPDGKNDYIVTFDNLTQRIDNVKILIIDNSVLGKDKVVYFPSFGIISNKGYSLDQSADLENKVLEGINLVILDNEEINYLLVYIEHEQGELFLKIKVN